MDTDTKETTENDKINQLLIILAEKQDAYREATSDEEKKTLQSEMDALQSDLQFHEAEAQEKAKAYTQADTQVDQEPKSRHPIESNNWTSSNWKRGNYSKKKKRKQGLWRCVCNIWTGRCTGSNW